MISLAPGITDTLYSLQLDDEIVGRTRYCIYPKNKVEQSETIGGTKKVNVDKIRSLKPDLIIAEKEENTKEIVEMLEKEFPVYVAEVQTVDDAYKMIESMGKITAREQQAEQLISSIKSGFSDLPKVEHKKIGYVIWTNPYMVVGNNTYINSVLTQLGYDNVFNRFEGRYPTVTLEDLQKANLDELFLATEPFPFKEEHLEQFSELLPNVKISIIDGEMFWYGPRMLDATQYFQKHLT